MLKNPSLLGDLQQKILRHLLECKEKDESVSHISRELDTLQPAVFRSIKSLMSEGYLTKEEGYRGGEKPINLTPKGAAAAALLEITQRQFENTNKNSNNSLPDLQRFLHSIRAPSKKDFLYRQIMEFFLREDLSYIQKDPDGSLFTKFLTKIAPDVATIFDDVHSVEEFVDKYNLDKDLLKNLLEERKHNIESLLYRLDKVKSQQEERPEWAVQLVGQEPIEVPVGIKETSRMAQKALKAGFKHFNLKIDPLARKVTEMSIPSKIKTEQEQSI